MNPWDFLQGVDWGAIGLDVIKFLISGTIISTVVATIIALRKDRRESKRDSLSTLKDMMIQTEQATAKAMEAMTKATTAEEKADQAERRAAKAEQSVKAFQYIISKHIIAIIDWIDDGADPPPPVIDHELRDFINDIQAMEELRRQRAEKREE